jgi:hypothetical protein
MKYIFTLLIAFSLVTFGFINHSGGIYKSNTGNIEFFSHTAVEDIKAENHKVKTAFDAASGKIQYSVVIKDFQFEKALMQEHFNEKYMESTKYPRSTFNGTIDNVSAIKFDTDGTYTSKVSGKLTIKDVTKQVSTTGTFVVKGGKVNAKASFRVNPTDYNIKIPNVVKEKISNNLKVSIDVDYVHSH